MTDRLRHPFEALSGPSLRRWFFICLALTLPCMVALFALGEPLRTDAAPGGIISYEFVWSVAGAQRVIDSWDAPTRLYAAFNLGFDYLFLLLYSTNIGMACVLSGRRLEARRGWTRATMLGASLAWGMWVAAVLDGVENAALLVLLLGHVQAPWPAIATWSAIPKFVLVAAGLLFALVGMVAPRAQAS